MFSMRLKIGPSRNNEWRCFICLHVRTATTLLGIWQLMLHVLALSILALLMRNHHNHYEKGMINMRQGDYDNILPTPLSKTKSEDNPYYLPTTQDGNRLYDSDMDMGALMTVCTLAITLLLVYGTVKGKAPHLLPFFCLQLFDFAITTLTATGYFCYLRSVHNFVSEHWHNLPYRKELLQLSPQWLSLIVVASFFFCMLWKAYCISIVWRCYKYLTLRQQATRNTVHYIVPSECLAGGDRLPEPDYSSLLPDYDAACASAMKQPPPPSYQAAMAGQPPSYPEAVHVVNIVGPLENPIANIRSQQQQQEHLIRAEALNPGFTATVVAFEEQERGGVTQAAIETVPVAADHQQDDGTKMAEGEENGAAAAYVMVEGKDDGSKGKTEVKNEEDGK